MGAKQQGFSRIALGYGAAIEKTRFGCRPQTHDVFIKSDNDYHMELLREHILEASARR